MRIKLKKTEVLNGQIAAGKVVRISWRDIQIAKLLETHESHEIHFTKLLLNSWNSDNS